MIWFSQASLPTAPSVQSLLKPTQPVLPVSVQPVPPLEKSPFATMLALAVAQVASMAMAQSSFFIGYPFNKYYGRRG